MLNTVQTVGILVEYDGEFFVKVPYWGTESRHHTRLIWRINAFSERFASEVLRQQNSSLMIAIGLKPPKEIYTYYVPHRCAVSLQGCKLDSSQVSNIFAHILDISRWLLRGKIEHFIVLTWYAQFINCI